MFHGAPELVSSDDRTTPPVVNYDRDVAAHLTLQRDGMLVVTEFFSAQAGASLRHSAVYLLDVTCGRIKPQCVFVTLMPVDSSTTANGDTSITLPKAFNTPGVHRYTTPGTETERGESEGSSDKLVLSTVVPTALVLLLIFLSVATLLRKRRHRSVHLVHGDVDDVEMGVLGADDPGDDGMDLYLHNVPSPAVDFSAMPSGFFENPRVQLPETACLLTGLSPMHRAIIMVSEKEGDPCDQ